MIKICLLILIFVMITVSFAVVIVGLSTSEELDSLNKTKILNNA